MDIQQSVRPNIARVTRDWVYDHPIGYFFTSKDVSQKKYPAISAELSRMVRAGILSATKTGKGTAYQFRILNHNMYRIKNRKGAFGSDFCLMTELDRHANESKALSWFETKDLIAELERRFK